MTDSLLKLLRQYDVEGRTSAEARRKHVELLLSLISREDLPVAFAFPNTWGPPEEIEEHYRRLRLAFEAALSSDPENLRLHRNFCRFLLRRERRRAAEIAEKLVILEPQNATNYRLRAYLHERLGREAEDEAEKRRHDEKALESWEAVIAHREEDEGDNGLDMTLYGLVWAAYRLGRTEEARHAARRAIDLFQVPTTEWRTSSIIQELCHNAHTVLGLISLDRGDLEGARRHLLASVDFPSPQQMHFVALDLGRRLLQAGDTDVVRKFADRLMVAVGCSPSLSEVSRFRDEVRRDSVFPKA